MAIATAASPVEQEALLKRVRRYLKDLDADPSVVRHAIFALDDSALDHYGRRSFHMNLLATLGDQLAVDRVRELAAQLTREKLWRGWRYYSYLVKLGKSPDTLRAKPVLEGMAAGRLRTLLATSKGLVICTCHLGDYRYLPSDLALAGIRATTPMDSDAFAQSTRAQEESGDKRIHNLLRLVNVETAAGSIALARALARGEIVVAFVDGNTGLDGPLGHEGRSELDLFGFKVRVKNGMTRLAARTGCPILPVVAPRKGAGVGRLVAGPLLRPEGRLRGAAQVRFVEKAMVEMYRFFERNIREYPDQWETCCFFHRWRQRTSESSTTELRLEAVRRKLEHELSVGKVLRLNCRRIVELRNDTETVWTDVVTLRAYRAPEGEGAILDQLAQAGVDKGWLEAHDPKSKDCAMSFLAFLKAREALTVEK